MKPYLESDDKAIKKWASIKKAEDIAAILGRSRQSLQAHAQRIGVSLKMKGEDYHTSKLSNLQVEMIHALTSSGFKPCDIHKAAFNHVNYDTVHFHASII